MRNVLVLQHVAHEPLGTLNPLLKANGLRIRYVNFERDPHAQPDLDGYNGLIVLGGPMGVYEASAFPHLKTEMKLIEEAVKRGLPVLGICLGAQLIAHVLGARVGKNKEFEIGWHDLHLTDGGGADVLFKHFKPTEKVFQMHGDFFEVPKTADHLAWSQLCEGQAFRYGEKVYGLQCHLEVDVAMIRRWLNRPENIKHLLRHKGEVGRGEIERETQAHIQRSLDISRASFQKFVDLFGLKERPVILGSGHEKPKTNR